MFNNFSALLFHANVFISMLSAPTQTSYSNAGHKIIDLVQLLRVRSERNDCNIFLSVYFYENGNSGHFPFKSPTWHIHYLNMSKTDRCSSINMYFYQRFMTMFLCVTYWHGWDLLCIVYKYQ